MDILEAFQVSHKRNLISSCLLVILFLFQLWPSHKMIPCRCRCKKHESSSWHFTLTCPPHVGHTSRTYLKSSPFFPLLFLTFSARASLLLAWTTVIASDLVSLILPYTRQFIFHSSNEYFFFCFFVPYENNHIKCWFLK